MACIFSAPREAKCQTPVTTSDVVTVANNWLHLGQEMDWGWKAAPDFNPASAKEIIEKGEVVGYFLSVPSGGYILLPACRELPPVTAYSSESAFSPNDAGGFAALVREELHAKIGLVRSCLSTPTPPVEWTAVTAEIEHDRSLWQAYTASYSDFSASLAAQNSRAESSTPNRDHRYSIDDIQPLVTTSWHQNAPFNNLCPLGQGGGHCAVGCVATACAQILAFWGYPAAGTGSHSYAWNGDQSCGSNIPGATLSATYSDSYDWGNMLDSYVGSETAAEQTAVAELSYEVGVALNMDYGVCGSGANTASVASILPLYFGYAGGIEIQYRNAYSTAAAWFTMLQEDLNIGRPMQYRIQSHSIVCDGWRVSGGNQIHLNYGWNDGHTTWYTVDNLYCTWTGCSPSVEYVVRHIRPSGAIPSDLTLTCPNGGEVLEVGEQHTIQWTSQNVTGNVKIELNRNYPAGSWETLTASTSNSGTYLWTVTAPTCQAARARISSVTNPAISDTSDANFAAQSAAPPQITAQVVSDGLRLAWHDTGSAYYRIYSSDAAGGPYSTFVGSTSDTTYTTDPVFDLRYYTVTSSTTP
ncbi:MAG TPA: C10 family peptidase [bacterium]